MELSASEHPPPTAERTEEAQPKKKRKRRTKAEIEQAKVGEVVKSLIVQVERMHRGEERDLERQRKRRSKVEIEQAKVRDVVNSLIVQVERMQRAEERERERDRERERKRRSKEEAEEARVRDTVRSWLCGSRSGLIAKIERAHEQSLADAEKEQKRRQREKEREQAESEREVQSVLHGLVKQLERAEAQEAQDFEQVRLWLCGTRSGLIAQLERAEVQETQDFEQVRLWLCGTRSGLIAQLERQHEQAEAVIHNLFYATRSGLIARVEREARDAAEESFRAAEVQRLLQRSGQGPRDSLGVFSPPQSPAERDTDTEGKGEVRFWWAKLQCVKKAVVRRTSSLTSEKIGVVKKRHVVQVAAFAEVDDVHRVQLARGIDGAPGGWLSITSTAGNILLEQVDEGKNNPPPVKVRRLTTAEKWAEEERAQREAHLTDLAAELRSLSLEALQKRALRENIGVARLMAALQQESWGVDVLTPKQAMVAMLLEAEEVKLDAPIVSSYRGESTALSPLPLIFSYKSEKSLCGTGLLADSGAGARGAQPAPHCEPPTAQQGTLSQTYGGLLTLILAH